jgi:hypothetical protein
MQARQPSYSKTSAERGALNLNIQFSNVFFAILHTQLALMFIIGIHKLTVVRLTVLQILKFTVKISFPRVLFKGSSDLKLYQNS